MNVELQEECVYLGKVFCHRETKFLWYLFFELKKTPRNPSLKNFQEVLKNILKLLK